MLDRRYHYGGRFFTNYSYYPCGNSPACVLEVHCGPLKQQVELCYFDLGTLDGCSDSRSGNAWNLERAVKETRSKYVFGAEVKDGVIVMYSQNIHVNGEQVFTEILVPHLANDVSNDYAISWKIAPESTCKQADLC